MNPRDRKSIPAIGEADEGKGEMPDPEPLEGRLPDFATMTAAERGRFQLEVADYIQTMCSDLRAMAQAAELNGLAYFIDMARIEASFQVESRTDKGAAG